MAKRFVVEVGARYGRLTVLSEDRSKGYPIYLVRCDCGREFDAQGGVIHRFASTGCSQCRHEAELTRRVETARAAEIGKRYGSVVVQDVRYAPMYGDLLLLCADYLCDCGQTGTAPLSRLHSGGCRSCGHHTPAALEHGRELARERVYEGSRASSLYQSLSKNNTSGVKGVSLIRSGSSAGKYRAYINFQHRQINVGAYDTLAEAADARARAEEEIFAPYLAKYGKAEPPPPELPPVDKKAAHKAYMAAYYQRNKDKYRQRNREYYQRNKEVMRDRSKVRYERDKEQILAQQRTRHQQKMEAIRADESAYQQYKEAAREKTRDHYQEHREEILARQRARHQAKMEALATDPIAYQQYKESVAAKNRAYYRAHKAELSEKRRAKYQVQKAELADKRSAEQKQAKPPED